MDWLTSFREELGEEGEVTLLDNSSSAEDAYIQATNQPHSFLTTNCPTSSCQTCTTCLSTSCCDDTCSCTR